MRYKGYAVTYAGEKLKVNKENFFLNGMYRDRYDDPNFFATNKDFRRRNLYAISSAVKSDDAAEELSYLAVDVLSEFTGNDFLEGNREYFSYANSVIGSHVLERNDGHFEVDTTVLHIQSDVATVFSMGDVQAYYFEKNRIRKMSGEAPKVVEIEKTSLDEEGFLQTEIIEKNNIPYLGCLMDDCVAAPFVSESIKLRNKSFFVLCSKAVSDAVSEKEIEQILSDKKVKNGDKATKIMELAIEQDPGENYTVLVVEVCKGLPITDAEFRSLSLWLAITVLCGAFYLASPYIVKAVLNTVESGRNLIEEYKERDENEENLELKWTPKTIEKEDEEEPEKEVEAPKPSTSKTSPRPAKKDNQANGAPKQTEKPSEKPAPSQITPNPEKTGKTDEVPAVSQPQPKPEEAEKPSKEESPENENPTQKNEDVKSPGDVN